MASQALEQLIERASSDQAFAGRLQADPDAAMAEYGLTEEEKQALRSRDPAQLQAAGVDERISKWFKR